MAGEIEEVGVEAVVKGFEAFLLKLEVMNAAIATSGTASVASAVGVAALGLAFGAVALAVTGILAGIGLLIGGFLALSVASFNVGKSVETAFAGVLKTTNGLTDEFGQMNEAGRAVRDQFRELAREVPLAIEELLRIGELAGQLGIAEEALVGFTEVVAALAVATDLSVEEASLGLARLANIYGVTVNDMVANTERLGSTITFLGNNFAATEPEILNFGKRIAGIAGPLGFAQAEVLGLGAAFASAGVESQLGATAVQNAMIEMASAVINGGEELEVFAETSGKTSEEFIDDWESDAAGAFVDFMEGLGDSGDDFIRILGEVGLASDRTVRALLPVAGAGDLLRRSIEGANEAWEANTALAREAEIRYGTLDSKLEILKNIVRDVGISISDIFNDALKDSLTYIIPVIDAIAEGLVPAYESIFKALTENLLPALWRLAEAFGFDVTNADLTQGIVNFGDTIAGGIEAFADFVDIVADLVDLYKEGGITSVAEHFGIKKEDAQLFLDVGEALLITAAGFVALRNAVAAGAFVAGIIASISGSLGGLWAFLTLAFTEGLGATIAAALAGVSIPASALLLPFAALIGVFVVFGERAEIAAQQLLLVLLIKFLEFKNTVVLLFQNMWTAIKTNTVQSISDWENNVIAWWQRTLDGIGVWVENIKIAIANMWESIKTNTKTSIDNFLADIETWRANTVEKIVELGVSSVQAVIDWWRDMIAALNAKGAEWGVQLETWIVEMAAKLREGISDWIEVGKEMMNGLLQGLKENVGKVLTFIAELALTVLATILRIFGVTSPSKVFANIGLQLMAGLAKGIADNAGLPQVALDAAAGGMVSAESQTMRGVGAGTGSVDNSYNPTINANYTETQAPNSIADDLVLSSMLGSA